MEPLNTVHLEPSVKVLRSTLCGGSDKDHEMVLPTDKWHVPSKGNSWHLFFHRVQKIYSTNADSASQHNICEVLFAQFAKRGTHERYRLSSMCGRYTFPTAGDTRRCVFKETEECKRLLKCEQKTSLVAQLQISLPGPFCYLFPISYRSNS